MTWLKKQKIRKMSLPLNMSVKTYLRISIFTFAIMQNKAIIDMSLAYIILAAIFNYTNMSSIQRNICVENKFCKGTCTFYMSSGSQFRSIHSRTTLSNRHMHKPLQYPSWNHMKDNQIISIISIAEPELIKYITKVNYKEQNNIYKIIHYIYTWFFSYLIRKVLKLIFVYESMIIGDQIFINCLTGFDKYKVYTSVNMRFRPWISLWELTENIHSMHHWSTWFASDL